LRTSILIIDPIISHEESLFAAISIQAAYADASLIAALIAANPLLESITRETSSKYISRTATIYSFMKQEEPRKKEMRRMKKPETEGGDERELLRKRGGEHAVSPCRAW